MQCIRHCIKDRTWVGGREDGISSDGLVEIVSL